jgi:hypothetical protein
MLKYLPGFSFCFLSNKMYLKQIYPKRAGLCAGVVLEFRPPTAAADLKTDVEVKY